MLSDMLLAAFRPMDEEHRNKALESLRSCVELEWGLGLVA